MLTLDILWIIINVGIYTDIIYSGSRTYILYDGNILHMIYDVNDDPLPTSGRGTCVVSSRLWCGDMQQQAQGL